MSNLDFNVKQFDAPRVVVVGGANMDVAASSRAPLVRKDSNPGSIRCAPGGVARNVAENLARLGAHVQFIGVVGEDDFGRRIVDQTRTSGVDVSGMVFLPEGRTSTYLSLHGPDGDMDVAVNDMEILDLLGPHLLEQFEADFSQASALVLDTNISSAALEWLLTGTCKKPCFVDGVSTTKCQKLQPYLSGIQVLKLNTLEAQTLTGMAVTDSVNARAAALRLHQLGVQQVVISMGAQGVAWCDADAITGHFSADAVEVVSASGAGDALLAGIVHGSLSGWTFPIAVQFGMQCAAFTLSSPYSNHPDLSVETVLRSQRGTV